MRKQSRVWWHVSFLVFCCGALPALAAAQSAEDAARGKSAGGLTLSAEIFCSETKLRTANLRIRWSLPTQVQTAIKAQPAALKQTLETTVYAQGFEKGLFVSLPVPAGPIQKPLPAVIAPTAAVSRTDTPRAFQIRLIEVGPPGREAAALDSAEFQAVVEDLEPGVNYTWRLTVEAPSGNLVSALVSVQAPVCPADMIEPRPPTKKPPPPKRPRR
jgi:hypothetical protein